MRAHRSESPTSIAPSSADGPPSASPRLYYDLAHLWPILSPPEDYVTEAAGIRAVLHETLGPARPDKRHSILELGTGGGHTLHHLCREFDCVAVDLSEAMLDNARRLNPNVQHHVGDMRTFRMDRTFDAVLVHDAIDYMTTEDDLLVVFATAEAHLRTGGILILAPTEVAETFEDHAVEHDHNVEGELCVTYATYQHDPDPTDTTVESVMVYFLRDHGRLRVEVDRHTLGLFTTDTWMTLLDQAGFDASLRQLTNGQSPHDRQYAGLFVGVLR